MDYKNLQNNLFYGLLIIAIIYVVFCITDIEDPKEKYNRAFSQELMLKLETVKDLDADEKRQIQEQASKILNKKSNRMEKVTKQSLMSSLRGGIMGGLVGGVEGALAGGVAFGVVSPVMILIESMI